MLLPDIWVIAAQHDLARPDLGPEVTQCLRRDHQRVEVKLAQIFGRLFLQFDARIAARRRNETGVIVAWGVGWQVASAMRPEDLQAREFVERALEDQMLQSDRRAKRI